MAAAGANLVIDEVLLLKAFAEDWLAVLPDVPVLMVGVQSALAELERRELARGDRVIGQARGQFGKVLLNAAYDVEVETDILSLAVSAKRIAEALDAGRFQALAAMRAAQGKSTRGV